MQKLSEKEPFTFFADADEADKYIELVKRAIVASGAEGIDGMSGFVKTNYRDIKKWNAFIKTLETSSVNGIINLGAIKSKDGPQWLVKTDISTNSDPIIYEYYIGQRLNVLRKFIPNFVVTFGGFRCEVNLYDRDDEKAKRMKRRPKMIHEFCSSPELKPRYMKSRKMKDFIVSEKIEPASSLGDYIKTNSAEKSVYALIQVLCALQFAQDKLDFTHYDLHAQNVLRHALPKEWNEKGEVVFMYNLSPSDELFNPSLVIPVPSEAIWVVIDFGRSYVKDTPVEMKNMWLEHGSYPGFSKQGLDPMHFNPMFDPVRLVSHSSSYNARLSAIKDRLSDWDSCITSKDYDMVKLNCTGDVIKGPLSMIEALEESGVCPSRREIINRAAKLVWYGNPITNIQKAAVMRKYGVKDHLKDDHEVRALTAKEVHIKPDFRAFVERGKRDHQLYQRMVQRGGGCEMKTLYYDGKLMDRNEMVTLLISLIGEEQYNSSTAPTLPDNELCQIISDALAE